MTYEKMNIFHKFLYNEVDYNVFNEIICESSHIPVLHSMYIDEKWNQYQKSPIQFAASFDEKFFNVAYTKMKDTNYKG